MKIILQLWILIFSVNVYSADIDYVREDIQKLLHHIGLNKTLLISSKRDSLNKSIVKCSESKIEFNVSSLKTELIPTVYKTVEKMGFLFPHPRKTIFPSKAQALKICGQTIEWQPALKFRGFHFHTQHPNEWVHGFLKGKKQIIEDTIKWLSRNKQNVFQFVLLRQKKMPWDIIKYSYDLSHRFGLEMGLSVSFNFQQQKSFKLLSLFSTFINPENSLRSSLEDFVAKSYFDFLTIELGSSEFTSTSFEKTLKLINIANEKVSSLKKKLFFKIHVSSNQNDDKWGNFNFLPAHAHKSVGILPHTVMFYGLNDKHAPMYGRKNFNDMKAFMLKEKNIRPTWYFPETSYYIGLDIDVPLFLTDYLRARHQDMKELLRNGIEGQINFTTGHELGYWFFDWAVALFSDKEHLRNLYSPLELLGEDVITWKKNLDFQTNWIKHKGLISSLSSSNLLDEIPFGHKIHKRNLIKELFQNKDENNKELNLLRDAVKKLPDTNGIKNKELKILMKITHLRFKHALKLREAIKFEKKRNFLLDAAKSIRLEAQEMVNQFISSYARYPDAYTFVKHKNPTSYQYGYGLTVKSLHFWKREEMMVRKQKFNPFFMNIYNIFDLMF